MTDDTIDKVVDMTDDTIDKVVDAGSQATKKTIQKGKDIRDETHRAVLGIKEVEKLERLAKLWREGALTDEEFKNIKADILKKM